MKKELITILLVIFTLINITWTICNKTISNDLDKSAIALDIIAIENQNISDSLEVQKRLLQIESDSLNDLKRRINFNLMQLSYNKQDTMNYRSGGTIKLKAIGTGIHGFNLQTYYLDSCKTRQFKDTMIYWNNATDR